MCSSAARMRESFFLLSSRRRLLFHCGLQIANIAPLNVIEQAIEYIISGEIVNYKYNVKNQEIIRWK
jgi:hypothetical protein